MRTKLSTTILIVLTLALSATPAQAGGIVTVCDEAHLLAELAGGGKVTFACSGTITLTATVVISADTTIDGSGQVVTISGNDAVRVFTVNPDAALKMNQLTIADGNDNGVGGGGIYNNRAHVVVANSIISGNHAAEGGGIFSGGGSLAVRNCTFSGNQRAITSASNSGILRNTIVANSASGTNCTGTIIDGGGNLSYPDTSCPGINADPLLGPLQDNGGPTWTMALGEGSAAIDAGDDAICAGPPVNNLDQRGVSRPQGTHCDIGAVEQITGPSAVRFSALSAQSLPNALSRVLVAGILMLALAGGAAMQHSRNWLRLSPWLPSPGAAGDQAPPLTTQPGTPQKPCPH